ncbi:MAG: fumarylacetoacetate hydrolase family protein [Planctomycetota bacterium]|jgi:2-keto-4-pentenoate hydratase/2-oxohepta-3-ene-1,7-dioic acid hydratase in catechol pathway
MKFFAFTTGDDLRLGVEIDGEHSDVSKGVMHEFGTLNLQDLIEFHEIRDVVEFVDAGKIESDSMPDDFTFLPPMLKPGKILAMLQNYKKHAEEFGNTAPPDPVWFGKLASSMTGHQTEISVPDWIDGRVDHEVELGVVIGEACKEVSDDEALAQVAGYTVINDVSARRIQKQDKENRHPWLRCKNFDTFTPMGPYFVPRSMVKDPQNLQISCRVNDEVRQNSNTSEMIHPVAKVVSTLSKWMTLLPGDVIATGTPEGVNNLRDGDVVECEIKGIGTLRNTVHRPKAS